MLNISFDTTELKKRCCEYAVAETVYGALNARALLTALADAEAMENAADWIKFLGEEVAVQEDCSLMLAFGSDSFARLIPVGTKFEKEDDGTVKWQTVRYLKLVQIGTDTDG
ncbi:MAG: hypothetical protein H2042_05895 [Rhizobiales bacterium]|nr:hypothetical protein [Hyphomicrobiales bacterium]